jgi:predicted amidohydrolase YtcJ
VLEHDFSIMEISHTGEVMAEEMHDEESEHDMSNMEMDPAVHVAASSGGSHSVEFTPSEAGELLFPESKTPDEIISLVKDYVMQNPDVKIIRGTKWATSAFPGGKATKEWLDPHFPNVGIMLSDETGHNAVANSKALEMAGITKDTEDPPYGVIDRDPESGEPTGYLSESAIGLIGALIKRADVDTNYRGISRALDQIRAYGTTSIVDMATGPEALEAYRQLEKDGKLNIRVAATIPAADYAAEVTLPEDSEAVLAKRKELETPLIKIGLKFWADGSPLSKTSLLLEPYSDDPSTKGEMTIGEAQFERIIKAHNEGMQVRAHSTGDGTTRQLLDVIEKAQAANPQPGLRHHIGHLMVVHPDDIPRFKELNVIAEFSPALWHPTSLGDLASSFVGAARYARWQPIKEFVDAGVTVTFGSDWPAGTPDADPWRGLEAMITRMDTKTNAGDKLGEGIDLETAIKVFTINGAKEMMHEDEAGSIEVGKHADMVLLDRNLFEIPPTEISEVKVLRTVFAGESIYETE